MNLRNLYQFLADRVEKRPFLTALVLAAFEFIFWLTFYGDLVDINIYFLRDLNRARAIAAGHLILEGSDTIGGGHTLGPFFYILMLPGVLFDSTFDTAILWIALLRSLGHSALALYFFPRRMSTAVLLWTFLAASPAMTDAMIWINNASLIDSYVAAILILSKYFLDRGIGFGSSWKTSLGLGLCIGLACQIHFSALFLAIIVIYLSIKSGPTNLKKGTWLFLLGWLMPQIPLLLKGFYEKKFHLILFESGPALNLGIFFPLLLADPNFNLKFVKEYLPIPSNAVAVFILLLAFYLFASRKSHCNDPWFQRSTPLLPFLSILMIPWAFNLLSVRYLVIVLTFIILHYCHQLSNRFRPRDIFISLFILGMPVLIWDFYKPRFSINANELKAFSKIFNDRCIPFWQMERVTYEVLNPLEEGGFALSETYFNCTKETPTKVESRFLVVERNLIEGLNDLKGLSLPDEVKRSLLLGWGKIKEHEIGNRLRLFEWPDSEVDLTEKRSNLVFSYLRDPILKKVPPGATWRICTIPYSCDLQVSYAHNKRNLWIFLSGRSISSRWPLPPLTATIHEIEVEYECPKRVVSKSLARKIGVTDFYSETNPTYSTFFGDFIGKIQLECTNFRNLALKTKKIDFWFEARLNAQAIPNYRFPIPDSAKSTNTSEWHIEQ